MAGLRTIATTLLHKTRCQNKKAQLEEFADNFDDLIRTLKILNFLQESPVNLYDKAKLQMGDDYVKTEHGNVAENVFRNWLNAFLPKRFAATKGYIITPSVQSSLS